MSPRRTVARRWRPLAAVARHEHAAVLAGLFKWVALASVLGALVGASTAGFLWVLARAGSLVGGLAWSPWLPPLAFAASLGLVRWLAPEAEGHGTERVIEAVHERAGRIDPAVVPVKLGATVVTLACGGSAGKEGPCAQIGAGLASAAAGFIGLDDRDRRKAVICGVSAGFAAVFGTPVAGALFGIEVLHVGRILYDVMLPSFVAGLVGYHVCAALGVTYLSHALAVTPVFSERFFLHVIGSGVWSGLWAVGLIWALGAVHRRAKSSAWSPWTVALAGGAVVAGLGWLADGRPLGLGLPVLEATLGGTPARWTDPAVKIAATAVTLGTGGSGGIVTPIFWIGAAAGSLYARVFALDPATFAAIGLVATLAGAANTPIAASVMAIELFGPAIASWAALACVVAFLMTGRRSVYPSQRMAAVKTLAHDLPRAHRRRSRA